MERSEELFEIGGPMILEELGPNKRMIEPKELPEAFIIRCPDPTLVQVSGRGASTEDLILLCDISENATRCHLGCLSRMGVVVLSPKGDRRYQN